MKNLREIKKMRENGITLVALVITIIILLILAGISISALTNTGIFQKAKDAKNASENAEEKQNKILSEYEKEIDQYEDSTLISNFDNGKIKVGDYILYKPDTISKADPKYKELISNFKTYSGSDENTTETIEQEADLKWRVLDIKDGQVRIISEKPTTSTVELKGYKGYNNGVKLLDDTCNTLYINMKLSNNVQNLKIEDIQDKMIETNYNNITSNYGKIYEPNNKYYPMLLEKEENQNVNGESVKNLGTSEQYEFENQKAEQYADKMTNTYSFWFKEMVPTDFKFAEYYNIFINNNGENYLTYWMSSRSISGDLNNTSYEIRIVGSGVVHSCRTYLSNNTDNYRKYGIRPVVTLNSNVKLDITNSGDGTIAEQAWAIKK